jgi:zinc/manganese transport system substrate-binding protein
MRRVPLAGLILLCAGLFPVRHASAASENAVSLVAAENFYGDVAAQIAGAHVTVTSIMNNPDQDPHLFEASPSGARDLATAQIVVANGADYDPWIGKLLGATAKAPDGASGRKILIVADVMHRKPGANPHLWYDPSVMPVVAKTIAADLIATDPTHAAEYDQRLQAFITSLEPLQSKIADLKQRFAGVAITATEPIFGLMAKALGLKMRNERFQLAVMNNTEPRASDVAAFEDDLRGRRVRVLIVNRQATDAAAQRLVDIAKQAGVPIVAVTETEPAGLQYQDWMLSQLKALEAALASAA